MAQRWYLTVFSPKRFSVKNSDDNLSKGGEGKRLFLSDKSLFLHETEHLLRSKTLDIDATDNDGNTIFHFICKDGRMDEILLNLDRGASVTAKNNIGQTPLHVVARHFSISVHAFAWPEYPLSKLVIAFVNQGADVDAEDAFKRTPLYNVCKNVKAHGSKDSLRFLLSREARVNVKTSKGMTPLHVLAKRDRGGDAIKILLDNGADVNALDGRGRTPFQVAVEHFNLCGVKQFLENATEIPTFPKETVLNFFNSSVPSPYRVIEWVATCGNAGLCRFLFSATTSGINEKSMHGYTPLHLAAKNKDSGVCKLFIENGALVNQKNAFGYTPLHIASMHGKAEVCALLLDSDASIVDEQENDGDTSLHLASSHGYLDVCKVLLDRGARIDLVNKKGKTPLECAVEKVDVADLLRKREAEINATK